MTAKFKLLDSNAKEKTAVRLFLYFDKTRFVWNTGFSIPPALWDEENERPTTNRYQINQAEASSPGIKNRLSNLVARLKNIEIEIERFFKGCAALEATPTKEALKAHLDRTILSKEPETKKVQDLNSYLSSYIKDLEEGRRHTVDGKRYTKGTLKNWWGFQAQLNEFQRAKRRVLDFNDITLDFYEDFLSFFEEKNYSVNTIGRHVKNLKTLMKAALEEKLHSTTEFQRRKFKVVEAETTSIYLTESELSRMFSLDLSKFPQLEAARDVFLVGCFTAQRFSDYSKLKPENIQAMPNGGKQITLIQKKTGERVFIPVRWELLQIMERYNLALPKTHEQKVNERIKKVAKLAGIDEPVLAEKVVGGRKVKETVPKYELVKTHTARRTGATTMYLAGIPPLDIMKITGHTTEKNLLKYIKVTREQTAGRLADHPYFTRKLSPLKVVAG